MMITPTHNKVMMVDIDEIEGQTSLSHLCENIPSESVSFSKVDVTNYQQLVRAILKTW